jgi:hypothetical protein
MIAIDSMSWNLKPSRNELSGEQIRNVTRTRLGGQIIETTVEGAPALKNPGAPGNS